MNRSRTFWLAWAVALTLRCAVCAGTPLQEFPLLERDANVATDAVPLSPSLPPELFQQGAFDGQPPASTSDEADMRWFQRLRNFASGRTQLEGGYSYLRGGSGNGSQTQQTFPDMLLRFGVTDRLELRVGWPGVVWSDGDDSAQTANPSIGLLYDLWPQERWIPQTAILVAAPIPVSGNAFGFSSLQPLSELIYGWELGTRTMLTGRTGLALLEDDQDDSFTQFQQGFSVDWTWTDRLGVFGTWDMLADHGSAFDTTQHMVGAGVSYLISPRWIMTWRAAVGVNESAPDFLNDIRFAYRF